MTEWYDLTRTLCLTALLSALVEGMLAGKRGVDIICLMLSLSGVGSILAHCAQMLR